MYQHFPCRRLNFNTKLQWTSSTYLIKLIFPGLFHSLAQTVHELVKIASRFFQLKFRHETPEKKEGFVGRTPQCFVKGCQYTGILGKILIDSPKVPACYKTLIASPKDSRWSVRISWHKEYCFVKQSQLLRFWGPLAQTSFASNTGYLIEHQDLGALVIRYRCRIYWHKN